MVVVVVLFFYTVVAARRTTTDIGRQLFKQMTYVQIRVMYTYELCTDEVITDEFEAEGL